MTHDGMYAKHRDGRDHGRLKHGIDRGRTEYLTNSATSSTRAHTIPPVEGQSNDGHENGTLGHRRCRSSTRADRPGAGARPCGRSSTRRPARSSPPCRSRAPPTSTRPLRIARAAFEAGPWPELTRSERARLLLRFADAIEASSEPLFELETRNNGRPITETRAQLSRVPEWFRYNAGLLAAQRDAVLPSDGPYLTYQRRTPLGRVRHHHPVQPPDADPGPQPVRRAGHRQHRRGQTLRTHPAHHPRPGRHPVRRRTSRRRGERGDRRSGGGRTPHPPSRRRQDHPDRWHRGRPRRRARHGRPVRQGDRRTRRQDPDHRLRRHRPAGRRRGRGVRRLRRGRSILRRRFPVPGAARHLRRSSSPRSAPARRPSGSATRPRPTPSSDR